MVKKLFLMVFAATILIAPSLCRAAPAPIHLSELKFNAVFAAGSIMPLTTLMVIGAAIKNPKILGSMFLWTLAATGIPTALTLGIRQGLLRWSKIPDDKIMNIAIYSCAGACGLIAFFSFYMYARGASVQLNSDLLTGDTMKRGNAEAEKDDSMYKSPFFFGAMAGIGFLFGSWVLAKLGLGSTYAADYALQILRAHD